jgi:hypothetical protein
MTPYQLLQAKLTREGTERLMAHLKKYGDKCHMPTYLRGFIEGGMFALTSSGHIVVPRRGANVIPNRRQKK